LQLQERFARDDEVDEVSRTSRKKTPLSILTPPPSHRPPSGTSRR
jgi:hypothetical protein